jgi:hypothetical protein
MDDTTRLDDELETQDDTTGMEETGQDTEGGSDSGDTFGERIGDDDLGSLRPDDTESEGGTDTADSLERDRMEDDDL